MPRHPVDPAQLEGDALTQWYQRTPDEIEAARRAAEEDRYREFFEPKATKSPQQLAVAVAQPDEDVLWVANGYGGYRAVRPGRSSTLTEPAADDHADFLPQSAAASEVSDFLEIGNPHNRRLKREYIKKHGFWPKTPDGRDYDVSHIRAIADGGTNTLDNIQPMHPDDHRAKHLRERDAERWGRRPHTARAFGGRVEPPKHAPAKPKPVVKGFGPLGILSGITGLLSGRTRTDNFDNFVADMLGLPSTEDYERESEQRFRKWYPNWKPGDQIEI